jgi:hypothetical protein
VLVCDERAWVFAPTALYVQPEVQSDETPNAVSLAASDVERIVGSLLPIEASKPATGDAGHGVEIGHELIAAPRLEETQEALDQAPPVPFDIARQVRVFEAYLQYVELSLTGAAIQKRRIHIPKSIQKLGAGEDLEGRLQTTFDLIDKSGALSSKKLDAELNDIRNDLTRSLGKDHGRVVLKSAKPKLTQRLDELRRKLQKHQAQVAKDLQQQLDHSRDQLVEVYFPLAKAQPPDALIGQSLVGKPTDQEIRDWLARELAKVFPRPEEVLSKMLLEVRYKDVTFETLNRPDFMGSLERAYPNVNWHKPYAEFKAAGESAVVQSR